MHATLHYNSNVYIARDTIKHLIDIHYDPNWNIVFELYGWILSLIVTNDTIRRVKPTKGLKPTECDADVVFTTGGLSAEPKPGIIPDDAGLLLEFNTEGGVPYLQKR